MIVDMQKEKIYRDYHGKVFGYIVSRIGNSQNAEDLTEDVFVKVYERINDFDESKASLSTWIYTITKNTLTDYYRTQKIYEEVPETVDSGDSVEDEVCNAEMLEVLANALENLEERQRDVIILRFYKGKTLIEIAERMDVSYAYVKVLQNKALENLKKFLK